MPSPNALDGGQNLTPRRVTLVVVLGLFAVLAIAPMFFLKGAASERSSDAAYQGLAAYARSHNGDSSADAAAADALSTFKRTDLGDGREQLARLSDDGQTCWVLVVEDGPAEAPRKGATSDCD